ncbi:MAG: hypothetical protein NC310_05275 [Roseburia sp.]|nr:hypothetical protein [Anaeroplasma bactoclasticum]MCM1196471.1 hypothetical protein [Roseburia sp.]MCM1557883.1 hypothetical protein [Anaeroplasma bactoclasticum]
MLLLGLSACEGKQNSKLESKEFRQGDKVVESGLVFTYYTHEYLYEEVIPFVEEENYKSYYNYYYYDMSDYSTLPPIYSSFEGALWAGRDYEGLHQGKSLFHPETFYDFLRFCEPNHSPTSAYFYRLRDYFGYSLWNDCFIVTGYTEDLKEDVVIPSVIQDVPVMQVGFKALENAPMKSLTFLSNDASPTSYTLIHPYAISRCQNLKEIKTDAKVLSMGISNCFNLERICYISLVSDCSLYNLPKLISLKDCDARTYFDKQAPTAEEITFHNTSGVRKSSIYNCPNLIEITGYPLTSYKGVVYYDGLYPYYALYDQYTLTLKDEYFSDLSWNSYTCLTYNLDTMELYLPFLNQGLVNKKNCTIKLDSQSKKIIEEEDGYYVSVAYPKIVKLSKYYSSLYEEPVYLKIISK